MDVTDTELAVVHVIAEGSRRDDILKRAIIRQDYKEFDVELRERKGAGATLDKCGFLHCATAVGCIPMMEELLKHGASIEHATIEMTPLHTALYFSEFEAAKYLIEKGANFKCKTKDEVTPLHMAGKGKVLMTHDQKMKQLEVVKLMVEKGAVITAKTSSKDTPLMYHLKHGHPNVDLVKYLVDLQTETDFDINAKNKDGQTALHLAAENEDNFESFIYLIEHQADINITAEETQDTVFIVACKNGNFEAVKYLTEKYGKLGSSPTAVDPCTKNKEKQNGLYYSVNGNFREIVKYLLDLNEKSLMSHEILGDMIKIMPDIVEKAFNMCVEISSEDKKPTSEDYEVTFDYSFLVEDDDGDRKLEVKKEPLHVIMSQGNSSLLKHPLVISMLDWKWKKFARCLFLTAFGLLVLKPVENTCIEVFNQSFNGTTPENCEGLPAWKYRFLIVAAAITIVVALLRMSVELIQMIPHPIDYLKDWINWMEIPLYMCSIIFTVIFATPCLCVYDWQWQIGVVSIFLAWMVLITFLQKWPLTGIYVLMFLNILGSFLSIIFLALLLVIAFALVFYMLLFEPDEMRTPFSNPGLALVKVMTMTTGELDYGDLYHQQEGEEEIAFPLLSYLMWIIFLLLMPVLLNNLLVGLAVGDVGHLQKTASEKRVQLQIELILNIEEILAFLNLHRYCIVRRQKIQPNNHISLLPRCCQSHIANAIVHHAAKFYSKWFITSEFFTSGESIASAIKGCPKQAMEEKEKETRMKEKMKQIENLLMEQSTQQKKWIEEQNKKIEQQLSTMRETLEKLATQRVAK